MALVVRSQLVFGRLRSLGRQMNREPATAFAREELHSIADTEHREPSRPRPAQQCTIKIQLLLGYPIEFDACCGLLAARQVRSEIIAAGEQQAIDVGCQSFGTGLDREMDGETTGERNRVSVAAIDVEVVAAGAPATPVVQTERNPDSRSTHGTSIAICGMLPEWRKS